MFYRLVQKWNIINWIYINESRVIIIRKDMNMEEKRVDNGYGQKGLVMGILYIIWRVVKYEINMYEFRLK